MHYSSAEIETNYAKRFEKIVDSKAVVVALEGVEKFLPVIYPPKIGW